MRVDQRLFDIQNNNNKQNAKVTEVPLSTKFICRRVRTQKKRTLRSVAQKIYTQTQMDNQKKKWPPPLHLSPSSEFMVKINYIW